MKHSQHSLSKQLERVEKELAKLQLMVRSFDPSAPPEGVSAEWIRAMLQARRRREALFGPSFFADPAWDMLLELYAMRLTGDRATTSELCKAAAVPQTTALRWVRQLENAGLVVRIPDESDLRRIFVELSARAAKAMEEYFGAGKAGFSGI